MSSPPPSSPSRPNRALAAVGINDVLTRDKSDKSRYIDKEHEWQPCSHARRCYNCNSLGPCSCRGVSLPPEEKRRRIEAVLANTDFARTRQRKDFLRLAEQEAKERMALERFEEDCAIALSSILSLQHQELQQRHHWTALRVQEFQLMLVAVDEGIALAAALSSQRADLKEEESHSRSKIACGEAKEYQMHCDMFISMRQCLADCLIEQAQQRRDFCVWVMDIADDLRIEEQNYFEQITSVTWHLCIEAVQAITAAKAYSRSLVEEEATTERQVIEGQRTLELQDLLYPCYTREHSLRLQWIEDKLVTRQAALEEATVWMSTSISEARTVELQQLWNLFQEEGALREDWIATRFNQRSAFSSEAVATLTSIIDQRSDDLKAFYELFEQEQSQRAGWKANQLADLVALDVHATSVMLAIQSARADELHDMHGMYLDEHTLRLAFAEAKAVELATFGSACEAAMWQLFSTHRDEATRLAAAFEQGASDVLKLIQFKHQQRLALFQEYDMSAQEHISLVEADSRQNLKTHFEEEHAGRQRWITLKETARARLVEEEGEVRAASWSDQMALLGQISSFEATRRTDIIREHERQLEARSVLCTDEHVARVTVYQSFSASLNDLYTTVYHASYTNALHLTLTSQSLAIENAEHHDRGSIGVQQAEHWSTLIAHFGHGANTILEEQIAKVVAALRHLCEVESNDRRSLTIEAEAALSNLTCEYNSICQAFNRLQLESDARMQFEANQQRMKLSMLRESLSIYCVQEEGHPFGPISGLPEPLANGLLGATAEELEQLSAIVFAFGDHTSHYVGLVDSSLVRGAQAATEEARLSRTGTTLSEQREFYTNKHFTDGATQQAKLGSLRQNVANRKLESKRLESVAKEELMALAEHKERLDDIKDRYRGKK